MSRNNRKPASADQATRRQMIVAVALGVSGLAIGADHDGGNLKSAAPANSANTLRTSLHQQVDLNASPKRIYETLLDSAQFSKFSGEPAQIHGEAGGAFVMFGARIEGRTVELVANQRIVQAWRPAHWHPGVYSIVKFELAEQGARTRVILDHTGFPEGEFDDLDSGWKTHYWEPLKKYFA